MVKEKKWRASHIFQNFRYTTEPSSKIEGIKSNFKLASFKYVLTRQSLPEKAQNFRTNRLRIYQDNKLKYPFCLFAHLHK